MTSSGAGSTLRERARRGVSSIPRTRTVNVHGADRRRGALEHAGGREPQAARKGAGGDVPAVRRDRAEYRFTSSALPAGLRLAVVQIVGTPTATGTTPVSVTVRGLDGNEATRQLGLAVSPRR